jgi:hypothetical protein
VLALAHGLLRNTTLAELNLAHNGIGDEGAKALTAKLKHHPHLTRLDLRANEPLSSRGVESLAALFEANPRNGGKIELLLLCGCPGAYAGTGAKALRRAFAPHPCAGPGCTRRCSPCQEMANFEGGVQTHRGVH